VPTYLDGILARHRDRAAADARDLGLLVAEAEAVPAPRGLVRALRARRAQGALGVIAEIKRRSPSKGPLVPALDPAEAAADYAAGGATALSVLTDAEHFGARPDDLPRARAACELPVLRKDFTVSEADVCDARLMGADAVLLIAAALSDAELGRFMALARRLLLDVLVEVHEEAELERALGLGPDLIGVNQRDLATFEVDARRATRLAGLIPDEVVAVAESGIHGGLDAIRLADAGYDAVLVGESLVRADDRRAAVATLASVPATLRGSAARA